MPLFNREELIKQYADAIVEDMDMKTLVQFATDVILSNYEMYTNKELIKEIKEGAYEHLLDEK